MVPWLNHYEWRRHHTEGIIPNMLLDMWTEMEELYWDNRALRNGGSRPSVSKRLDASNISQLARFSKN
jgi:hypothetical protein